MDMCWLYADRQYNLKPAFFLLRWLMPRRQNEASRSLSYLICFLHWLHNKAEIRKTRQWRTTCSLICWQVGPPTLNKCSIQEHVGLEKKVVNTIVYLVILLVSYRRYFLLIKLLRFSCWFCVMFHCQRKPEEQRKPPIWIAIKTKEETKKLKKKKRSKSFSVSLSFL